MSKVLKALTEIQADRPTLTKDSTNPAFRSGYASLGAVLDVVVPLLNEKGVLCLQTPGVTESGPVLFTTLVSTEDSEDTVESVTPLILDKTTMQGMGSAITYARRYALVTMFNLDAEDDDGNSASGTTPSPTPARRTAPTRRGS